MRFECFDIPEEPHSRLHPTHLFVWTQGSAPETTGSLTLDLCGGGLRSRPFCSSISPGRAVPCRVAACYRVCPVGARRSARWDCCAACMHTTHLETAAGVGSRGGGGGLVRLQRTLMAHPRGAMRHLHPTMRPPHAAACDDPAAKFWEPTFEAAAVRFHGETPAMHCEESRESRPAHPPCERSTQGISCQPARGCH